MCSDALEFDNLHGISATNRKIAERDANRVLEAYARALCNVQFVLKRDVDIVLTGYSRIATGNFGAREYVFAVFEKGTDKFIMHHAIQL